jgi:hypothetical protein
LRIAVGRTLDCRIDDVGGISGHADAGDLSQNFGAARSGMFVGFEHRDGGAIAKHQSVAIGRERPADRAGKHAQRFPGLERPIDQRQFASACKHHVGAAQPDLVDGGNEGMVSRCAGRDTPNTGPLQPHGDETPGRTAARHHLGNGENVGALLFFEKDVDIALVDRIGPEDADADNAAGTVGN